MEVSQRIRSAAQHLPLYGRYGNVEPIGSCWLRCFMIGCVLFPTSSTIDRINDSAGNYHRTLSKNLILFCFAEPLSYKMCQQTQRTTTTTGFNFRVLLWGIFTGGLGRTVRRTVWRTVHPFKHHIKHQNNRRSYVISVRSLLRSNLKNTHGFISKKISNGSSEVRQILPDDFKLRTSNSFIVIIFFGRKFCVQHSFSSSIVLTLLLLVNETS